MNDRSSAWSTTRQWSDPDSSQVLGFVARRPPDSVVLVLAARDRHSEFACVPELHVGGLPDRDARALLMSALRAPLDEQVRERIVAEAEGNALAVLEVPRRVTPAQLAGGFGRPDAGTVSSPADAVLARQLVSLPDDSRRLLLVAAAEPLGEPLLLWRAAERLGIPSGAAGAAAGGGRTRDRGPRAVSPSADARGDLPVGIPPGAVPGPRRARRCHRRAIRSGTARMASRPRRVRARRERGRRARAFIAASRARAAAWPRKRRSCSTPRR